MIFFFLIIKRPSFNTLLVKILVNKIKIKLLQFDISYTTQQYLLVKDCHTFQRLNKTVRETLICSDILTT